MKLTESQLRSIIRKELQEMKTFLPQQIQQKKQPIDIEELVADISAGIYGDDRMSKSVLDAALLALDTLVEEIKRLQQENIK